MAKESTIPYSWSRCYYLFTWAFCTPDQALHSAIKSGYWFNELCALLNLAEEAKLSDSVRKVGTEIAGLLPPITEMEQDFASLLDLAGGSPICPPCERFYSTDEKVSGLTCDLTRRYRDYGLSLDQTPTDIPDHLTVELDFMRHLTFREGLAMGEKEDPALLVRAQGDFLSNHLLPFVTGVRENLEKKGTPLFYRTVGILAHRAAGRHSHRVARKKGAR